jgi:hypothetical protein
MTASINIIGSKVLNFHGKSLSFTIPNISDEQIKTTIWARKEKIKGTRQKCTETRTGHNTYNTT